MIRSYYPCVRTTYSSTSIRILRASGWRLAWRLTRHYVFYFLIPPFYLTENRKIIRKTSGWRLAWRLTHYVFYFLIPPFSPHWKSKNNSKNFEDILVLIFSLPSDMQCVACRVSIYASTTWYVPAFMIPSYEHKLWVTLFTAVGEVRITIHLPTIAAPFT